MNYFRHDLLLCFYTKSTASRRPHHEQLQPDDAASLVRNHIVLPDDSARVLNVSDILSIQADQLSCDSDLRVGCQETNSRTHLGVLQRSHRLLERQIERRLRVSDLTRHSRRRNRLRCPLLSVSPHFSLCVNEGLDEQQNVMTDGPRRNIDRQDQPHPQANQKQ